MMFEDDMFIFDWVIFYGVIMEDIKFKYKKEVERQNVLYEIVMGEEDFMNQFDVFWLFYRD